MAQLPWMIDDAASALRAGSAGQRAVEASVKDAYRAYAVAEQAYRQALAQRIVELRADGQPTTLAADLARGDERVARLKMQRDVAEGVKEAAMQASWRASADRRDAQSLAEWSQRREMAENR